MKNETIVPKLNNNALNSFLEMFGQNVAKLRKEKKMTQAELGQKCGSDGVAVSRVERGVFNIKISSLLLLANGLEVPVEKLFDFPDVPQFVADILNENPD